MKNIPAKSVLYDFGSFRLGYLLSLPFENIMDTTIYKSRRKVLATEIRNGIILLAANHLAPRNYHDNTYPFRQDSTFLYYTGISIPGIYLLIDCDSGHEMLAGDEGGITEAIWTGAQQSLKSRADKAGIERVIDGNRLHDFITEAQTKKRPIHFLPPYTAKRKLELLRLLNQEVWQTEGYVSQHLIQAVISQRSLKMAEEVKEIEDTLSTVTGPMHVTAMQMAKKGICEYEIVAGMQHIAACKNLEFAYNPICSVHGEILHNIYYNNKLKEGQLLLVDAGAESAKYYATDITRTIPVGGKFSVIQKDLYEIVLRAQEHALENIKPGTAYSDIHHSTALVMVQNLIHLGLMKGDAREAVQTGAHALFFMHGLGHMLGLDVHDMEDLGTVNVGYSSGSKPSEQFGTANLRLAKKLVPGNVITVEPGIYFNTVLIDLWESENRYPQFINYPELKKFRNFGGIRIEDNIVVTKNACRILGKPIPKTIKEIEHVCRLGVKKNR